MDGSIRTEQSLRVVSYGAVLGWSDPVQDQQEMPKSH